MNKYTILSLNAFMRLYSNVYNYAIYTLNNEDRYFISLFAPFKHTLKIYDQCTYAQIVIKKFSDKNFEMHFLRE